MDRKPFPGPKRLALPAPVKSSRREGRVSADAGNGQVVDPAIRVTSRSTCVTRSKEHYLMPVEKDSAARTGAQSPEKRRLALDFSRLL